MIKMVRGLLITAMGIAACLFVASPAQAAPAQITVTSVYPISDQYLQVTGTVICTAPTGDAHITLIAAPVPPTNGWGFDDLDVPCADGPVTWGTSVYSYYSWNDNSAVTVTVIMTDDHGGTAGATGTWPI